jgi:predicted transcriptional regulator
MRREHPLGQDVPRELQILNEMLKDELIQEASTVEHSGYVITSKGKELLAELKD